MRKIPTRHGKSCFGIIKFKDYFIEYRDQIFIIKKDNQNGNYAQFQFDGVCCRQGKIRGLVYKSFRTKSKWFNETWWYRKTVWSKDPLKIHFKTDDFKTRNEFYTGSNYNEEEFLAYWNKVYDRATLVSKPVDILREVNAKTNGNFEIDFTDLEYGKSWFEAYIPIKDKKSNKYLLTWNNCD